MRCKNSLICFLKFERYSASKTMGKKCISVDLNGQRFFVDALRDDLT